MRHLLLPLLLLPLLAVGCGLDEPLEAPTEVAEPIHCQHAGMTRELFGTARASWAAEEGHLWITLPVSFWDAAHVEGLSLLEMPRVVGASYRDHGQGREAMWVSLDFGTGAYEAEIALDVSCEGGDSETLVLAVEAHPQRPQVVLLDPGT